MDTTNARVYVSTQRSLPRDTQVLRRAGLSAGIRLGSSHLAMAAPRGVELGLQTRTHGCSPVNPQFRSRRRGPGTQRKPRWAYSREYHEKDYTCSIS